MLPQIAYRRKGRGGHHEVVAWYGISSRDGKLKHGIVGFRNESLKPITAATPFRRPQR